MKRFNHIERNKRNIFLKRKNIPSIGRVYIDDENNVYPSITTILDKVNKSEKLKEWIKAVGEKQAKKISKAAQERGTSLHEVIELYLHNSITKEQGVELLRNNGKLFNKIVGFLNKIDNIRMTESFLYSKTLKVAGTPDCIAEYDGKLSIIDFKTSTKEKTQELIENYILQISSYKIMYEEHFNEEIEQGIIIIATEKGFPQVYKVNFEDKYFVKLIDIINEFYRKYRRYLNG